MDENEMMNRELAGVMARTHYANTSSNELNSLLAQLTDPEQEIYEVELSLKGKGLDSKGNVIQVSQPLLNDEGVAAMIRIIRSMVSRVMFMSNLKEEQVSKLTIELGWLIATELVQNKVKYGVKNEHRSQIVSIILYKSYESANSALENGFRRFLKSGIIETTINTQGQNKPVNKSGGIFGFGKK